ncbi:hypothetical protein TNCV_363101 [Trichonephila clavipes]|nr:hypothetical protein TNCV_363101 [Trichonephila clavipes]
MSSDLNPIEHVWDGLGRVNSQRSSSQDPLPRSSRDLELEVNGDGIEELIMGHEDELTTELQEMLNEEHQETQ